MVETFGTEKIGRAKIAQLVDEHFDLRPGAFRKDARPAPADLPEDRRLRPLRPRGRGLHLGAHRQGRGARRGRRSRRSRVGLAQPSPAPTRRSGPRFTGLPPRAAGGRGRGRRRRGRRRRRRHDRDRDLLVGGSTCGRRRDHAHDLLAPRARLALRAFAFARAFALAAFAAAGFVVNCSSREPAERGRPDSSWAPAARGRPRRGPAGALGCTAAGVGALTSSCRRSRRTAGRRRRSRARARRRRRAPPRPGGGRARRAIRCFPACRTESASGGRAVSIYSRP